jgi:hypothetical protein
MPEVSGTHLASSLTVTDLDHSVAWYSEVL